MKAPFSVQGMGLCFERHETLSGEVLDGVLYTFHVGGATSCAFSNEDESEVWATARSEGISKVKKLKGGLKGAEASEARRWGEGSRDMLTYDG